MSQTQSSRTGPGAGSGAPGSGAAVFTEFEGGTAEAWRALVEAELKGAPFEKRMTTGLPEGITLRPVYGPADGAGLTHLGSWPGFAPFVRGTRASGYHAVPWEVSQEIRASSAAEFNGQARAGLERGLTALNVVLDRATRNGADPDWAQAGEVGLGGLSLATLEDLDRAFQGIDLGRVPIFIRSGGSGMPMAALLMAWLRRSGVAPGSVRGCVEVDPLGVLSHEGRLPQSLESAYREMASLTAWAAGQAPGLQTICVHGRAWHEAGGHAAQELAFTLATAVEYLREMQRRGLGVEVVAPRIRLAYTVGTRFFVETAKLRAARMLWARVIGAMGGSESAQRATLHVRTSLFNKSVYDPHVNLLRTTVEAFAAVLGGCDSLQVGAFDELTQGPNELAQRMARNQQLLLREECHLTQVIDPAGGSWLVETLTDELARRAWGMFQEVERQGGMAAALRAGGPQAEVGKVAAERLRLVAQRRETLVGVNQYANPKDVVPAASGSESGEFQRRRVQQVSAARMAAEDAQHAQVLEGLTRVVGLSGTELFERCVEAAGAGATLGEVTRAVRIEDRPEAPLTPVCLVRGAEGFERLRRAVDAQALAGGRRATVYLANLGPLKQHKARADFARGLFQTAGFEVVDPPGGDDPVAVAAAAAESGADAVCLCSTDETYPVLVPQVVGEVRRRRPGVVMILAGYPTDQVEAHRASGVDEFIHVRADALAVLTALARRMGVLS